MCMYIHIYIYICTYAFGKPPAPHVFLHFFLPQDMWSPPPYLLPPNIMQARAGRLDVSWRCEEPSKLTQQQATPVLLIRMLISTMGKSNEKGYNNETVVTMLRAMYNESNNMTTPTKRNILKCEEEKEGQDISKEQTDHVTTDYREGSAARPSGTLFSRRSSLFKNTANTWNVDWRHDVPGVKCRAYYI